MPLAVVGQRARVRLHAAHDRLTSPCTHRGELRVPRDLDAPPLVVGEMPVEAIQLMQREKVDVLLHELLGHEMARDIEVGAAPGKPRRILDVDGGHHPGGGDRRLAKDRRRQQLPQ